MKRIASLVLLSVLATAALGWAAIPETMSYQGVLRNSAGELVPDGDYQLTFKLHDEPSAGTLLWTEVQLLSVVQGVFNAQLGSVTPFGPLAFDAPYWLGVAVGADPELTPRAPLAAAPYALNARVDLPLILSSLDGVSSDQGGIDLVAGANITITPDDANNTITISATGGPAGITGSGTGGYVPKFTGATSIGDSYLSTTETGFVIANIGADRAPTPKDGNDLDRDRLNSRFRAIGTDTWTVVGEVYNNSANGVAGVYGVRWNNHDGANYGHGQSNAGVIGLTHWGNDYAFGVAGYTYGEDTRTGGVIGANHLGSFWGALGYKDSSGDWWGIYTEDSAHLGGLQIPSEAGEGKVLTSDPEGHAHWMDPPSAYDLMDFHNENATTVIASTATAYDNCLVTLTIPRAGFITVTTSCRVRLEHTSGTAETCNLNHSVSPTIMGSSYDRQVIEIPAGYPSDSQHHDSRTISTTFPVSMAGTYTYYLVGQMAEGASAGDVFWYAQMTAVYHPAAPEVVREAMLEQEEMQEKASWE